MVQLIGSAKDKLAQAEEIVQRIVPEAKCEIWDYEHRIRCGLVDVDGQKKEFSLLLGALESGVLEEFARDLKTRLVNP